MRTGPTRAGLVLTAMAIACGDGSAPLTVEPPAPPPPPAVPPPLTPPQGADGYVYVAGTDGSGTRLLARGQSPSWSPDGRRIVYSSGRDGDAEIFVVNSDATGDTQLTHNLEGDVAPVWSPLGDRIAFVSTRGWSGMIRVIGPTGSGLTTLTGDSVRVHALAWSPDGRQLAFTYFVSGPMDDLANLGVTGGDGSGPTRVLIREEFCNEFATPCAATWSPDGRSIAFSHADYRGNHLLWVVSADGSAHWALSRGPFDIEPAWSPDGNRIAFVSARDVRGRDRSISVMGSDGAGQAEVTRSPGGGNPQWLPDGQRILFDSDQGIGVVTLGSGVAQILVKRGRGARLSPDGTQMAFVTRAPL